MLQIDVYSSRAVIRSQEPLTVGMVGVKAHIHFAEPWQTLTKTVVFRQGEVTRDVVGVTEEAEIPWEVLQQPGLPVEIGFYGSMSNGSVVIPTVWVETEPICEGADPSGDPSTAATLPVYQQLQEQIDSKSLFVVTITGNDEEEYISSHSLSEIRSAYEAGRPVVARYGDWELQLAEINEELVHFEGSSAGLETVRVTLTKETTIVDKWQMARKQDVEACVGRLDEHTGSIDVLNTQSKALEERVTEQAYELTIHGQSIKADRLILDDHETRLTYVSDWCHELDDEALERDRQLADHAQTLRDHGDLIPELAHRLDDLELPIATPHTLGGVQPVAKTDEMTNPVGVDETGGLWTIRRPALTSVQISAFDELLRRASYKEDITNQYKAFRIAFGLDVVEIPTVVYSTKLVDRTLSGTYVNDRVTEVGQGAFTDCGDLEKLILPNVQTVAAGPDAGFSNGSFVKLSLDTLDLPNLTDLPVRAINEVTVKNPMVFEREIKIGYKAFMYITCPKVVFCEEATFDSRAFDGWNVPAVEYHKQQTITGITSITILRATDGVCPTSVTNFSKVNGVYVPAALLDSYKAATNWSSVADKIYAIEDNPDICE